MIPSVATAVVDGATAVGPISTFVFFFFLMSSVPYCPLFLDSMCFEFSSFQLWVSWGEFSMRVLSVSSVAFGFVVFDSSVSSLRCRVGLSIRVYSFVEDVVGDSIRRLIDRYLFYVDVGGRGISVYSQFGGSLLEVRSMCLYQVYANGFCRLISTSFIFRCAF